MRIGKFAESYDLTINTIRHYMDLELIIPEKQGGQYDFDSRCRADLEAVLNLKDMGFTLAEAKDIFTFRRLAKLTPYEENQYYKGFYERKYTDIGKEIDNLIEAKKRLEMKIKELQIYDEKEKKKMGISLQHLNILKCRKCGNDLLLSTGSIKDNQVVDGKLGCRCGIEYSIEDGILIINGDSIKNKFDSNYIEEYVSLTDAEYLANIYKNLELVYKKIDFTSFENKIILELGSGVGFFLRHIYNDLPENSIYIAIDNDLGRHKFLKTMLELVNCNKNIIFICSDFTQIPIADKSIDILADISGSSNYGFSNEEFLLDEVDNYVKEDALIIGSYIIFKNFSINSKINDEYKKNFNLGRIRGSLGELKYKSIYETISEPLTKGGKYEDFFVKGEEVYHYIYYGKR